MKCKSFLILHVMMNYLWFNRTLPQAVVEPRLHHQLLPMYILVDKDYLMPLAIQEGLQSLRHKVRNVSGQRSRPGCGQKLGWNTDRQIRPQEAGYCIRILSRDGTKADGFHVYYMAFQTFDSPASRFLVILRFFVKDCEDFQVYFYHNNLVMKEEQLIRNCRGGTGLE